MRLVIQGKIKTVGPLSIKMPVPEGGRENEYGNFPLMTMGVDDENKKLQTAYLPASTLRGFMRRAVVLRDMREAASQGKPYKLPQVYAEMIGQDTQSEKEAETIDLLALRQTREANPVLDLFGSSLGIKSRLKVGNFVPDSPILPDVFSGVRKDIDATAEALALLGEAELADFVDRKDDTRRRVAQTALVNQLARQTRALTKAGNPIPPDLELALTQAKEKEEALKNRMGDMKNSSLLPVHYFALAAGIELSGRIVVEQARERDMELLLCGMDALSRCPVLGANSARGCGEIAGSFHIHDEAGVLLKIVAVGGYKPAQVAEFSQSIA